MRQNSNASLHVCAVHMHDEVLEGDEVVEYLEEYLERSSSLDPTFANVGVSESSHRTLCRSLVRLGWCLRDGPMPQLPLTTLYQ